MNSQSPPTPAVYIYGLIDPRTKEIRYVGQTVDPDSRIVAHTRIWCGERKMAWINELIDLELEPEYVILQKSDDLNCLRDEQRWIDIFQHSGTSLLNGSQRSRSELPPRRIEHYTIRRWSGNHGLLDDIELIMDFHECWYSVEWVIQLTVARYAHSIRRFLED